MAAKDVRFGGEARGLLMAHANDLQSSQATAGVEQVRDHPAGHLEHMAYALLDEKTNNVVGYLHRVISYSARQPT